MGSQKGNLAVDDASRSGSGLPTRQDGIKAAISGFRCNERFVRDTSEAR
jgi:hypothetical protein